MTSARTFFLPASFQGAAVVGQSRIWPELERTQGFMWKRKAKVQAIVFGEGIFTLNKSQNDLSKLQQPTQGRKASGWTTKMAPLSMGRSQTNLEHNILLLSDRGRCPKIKCQIFQQTWQVCYVGCYDFWFWQPILSDCYSKPETSQVQKLSERLDMNCFFSPT